MELIVVRHGLPERMDNADGTPADPALSAEGWEQARRMSAWLAAEAVEALYASPLLRARQTVEPLAEALGLTPSIEPDIVEFDSNAASYVPVEELQRTDPVRFRQLVETMWAGEFDPAPFRDAVVAAMQRIIASHPGGRVAVICHGGVINVWAAHVLGIPRPMFFYPQYTSINRFRASRDGRLSVVSLNELGHLR